jgi:hypothetical protein
MFQHPFTLCLAGSTGSGKTQWLKQFLKNTGELIEPAPVHILYCYGLVNSTVLELKAEGRMEIFNGVPDEKMIQELPKPLLLCLDDLYLDMDGQFMDNLFTRGSHNWSVSVVMVTQNLFSKEIKTARNNSHILVLMRSPSSQKQIHNLGVQLFPGRRLGYFMEAFRDATSMKFGYLVINMHPNVAEEHRLSTHIFPGERTTVYLPLSESAI